MPQAELQTVTGALAALDNDLDMIQQQLEHQMQAQDQGQDDARSVIQLTVRHALSFGWLKLLTLFFFQLVLAAHTLCRHTAAAAVTLFFLVLPAASKTNNSHSHSVNPSVA